MAPDLGDFLAACKPSEFALPITSVSSSLMPYERTRILWSRPGNPPASIARTLGLEARRFSRALHKIKAAADLSGTDHVIIYTDGTVTDEQGEPIGNLYDED
ncbi:MAG: hypothetical protein JO007_18665 [Alphaproteobacteria bacterium]|nr:hypothetical protein [Alphaproteobacteria bacterium]